MDSLLEYEENDCKTIFDEYIGLYINNWNEVEDAKKMFDIYPLWEKYDEHKDYKNYKPINYKLNEMNNIKYETSIINKLYKIISNDKTYKYVVFYKLFTDKYFEELKHFCRCDYHYKYWFNPFRYFICRHCVGCLDCGQKYAQYYNIVNAEQSKLLSSKDN